MFSAFYKPKLAPVFDPCYAWIEAERRVSAEIRPGMKIPGFFLVWVSRDFPAELDRVSSVGVIRTPDHYQGFLQKTKYYPFPIDVPKNGLIMIKCAFFHGSFFRYPGPKTP